MENFIRKVVSTINSKCDGAIRYTIHIQIYLLATLSGIYIYLLATLSGTYILATLSAIHVQIYLLATLVYTHTCWLHYLVYRYMLWASSCVGDRGKLESFWHVPHTSILRLPSIVAASQRFVFLNVQSDQRDCDKELTGFSTFVVTNHSPSHFGKPSVGGYLKSLPIMTI